MSTPQKRKPISTEVKKKIIDAKEKNPVKSLADLAKEFSTTYHKLTRANIQTILNNKEQILAAVGEGIGAKRARLRKANNVDLEESLLFWTKQVRSENVAMTGPPLKVCFVFICHLSLIMFKEKAIEVAAELNIEDFKASEGWLENFKARHSIKFRAEQGEAAAVDIEVVKEWQQTILRESLSKYSPDDVFNADETGLFYRLMPNKTMAFKGKFTILSFIDRPTRFRRKVYRRKKEQRAHHCAGRIKRVGNREASSAGHWKV